MKTLEACLNKVKHWMSVNWLKLNDSKIEFFIFGDKKSLSNLDINSIIIGDSDVAAVQCVKSIGAHLVNSLKMNMYISSTCRALWFFLHQIGKIIMPVLK